MVSPTRRADAAANADRILDAASHVHRGTDGVVTLDRVAEEAGVGIATLYRHFPNRRALARGVYGRLFTAEVEPALMRVEAGDGSYDALAELAQLVVEVARRERALITSLGHLGEVTAELFAPHADRLDELVAHGRAAGTLRSGLTGADLPPLFAALAAAGLVLDEDPAVRRRHLALLLDGLRPTI